MDVSSARVEISVLVLTLNEGPNIAAVLESANQEIQRLGAAAEYIVVDGGSTDETVSEARRFGARVIRQSRPGYGAAWREGATAAQGEYLLCLDADGSHPPDLIEALWRRRHEADVVVGSRFTAGGCSGGPRYRRMLSWVLNRLFCRALRLPVKDISSGYRLYRRRILRPELYSAENFEVLIEVAVRAFCDGFRLAEVPLRYRPRRRGRSHAQVFRLGVLYLRALKELWTLRNSIAGADYDSRAFDSVIPIQRYWQRRRYRIVNAFLADVKGQIADIGCGSSRIIQDRPAAAAVDIQPAKLRFLRNTNPLRVCASAFALPFAAEAFDGLIHSQVIEHVARDQLLFEEMARVLNPGGVLVIGTPDYGRPWWPLIEFCYKLFLPNAYGDERITHYTARDLRDALERSGFVVQKWRYICGGELIIRAVKKGG